MVTIDFNTNNTGRAGVAKSLDFHPALPSHGEQRPRRIPWQPRLIVKRLVTLTAELVEKDHTQATIELGV